ncbi:MAG: RAMP superfamily CRISPR-associated protein [Candidatus Bathyarchaeia archaeon]
MGVIYKSPYDEYYSIDIIKRQPREIPSNAYHNRFEGWWGKMTLEIKAVSKVFVGTGNYELDKEGIYHPFARIGAPPHRKLVIPGTTIKGVVRTYAEALSPSCEGGECKECFCCSIFGALGFQGRITFCDTMPIDPKSVHLIKYNMSVRWSGGFKEGRRFYYHEKPASPQILNPRTGKPFPKERVETVLEGTYFISALFFENLNQEEIGLLLLAMGLSPNHRFNLKLGGGKNRRLGSVRFGLSSGIQLASSNAYNSFSLTYDTKQMKDWGKEVVEAYLNSLPNEKRSLVLESIQAFQKDP